MLQKRWWLDDIEQARIASARPHGAPEAQESHMDDFERSAIDLAGLRFVKYLH